MPDTSWREEVGGRVVMLQIVVMALITGSIGFLAVAIVLVQLGIVEPDRELASVMNLVLVLFLIAEIAARMIVPGAIVAQGLRKIAAGQWSLPEGPNQEEVAAFIERTGDAGRLLAVYQIRTLIAAALLEGVALLAIVVYLLTGSLVGPLVAVALIIGLVFHVPTRSGVSHWIEDQLQLIEQQRQLRSS